MAHSSALLEAASLQGCPAGSGTTASLATQHPQGPCPSRLGRLMPSLPPDSDPLSQKPGLLLGAKKRRKKPSLQPHRPHACHSPGHTAVCARLFLAVSRNELWEVEGQDLDEKEPQEEGRRRRQAFRKGSTCDSSPCGCQSPTSRDADRACGRVSSHRPGRTGEHRRLGTSTTRPRARGERSHWLGKSPGQKLCVILRPKMSSTSLGCPQALCGHRARGGNQLRPRPSLPPSGNRLEACSWTPGGSRGISGNLFP